MSEVTETTEVKSVSFEIKIRVLGNDLFSIGYSSSEGSNRYLIMGLGVCYCTLIAIGAYSDKIVTFYNYLMR